MSCPFYNNNGCSCAGCIHFVKTMKIVIKNEQLTLVIPQIDFRNHDRICLCLAQSIPADITPDIPVTIQIGTKGTKVFVPLITRLGNAVYADQVQSRKMYPISIGTDLPAFILSDLCKLNKTKHIFPTISKNTPRIVEDEQKE